MIDNESELDKLLNRQFNLSEHQKRIKNQDLQLVIREYFRNRNMSAHYCQEIPIDAAQTYIRRTYEIIPILNQI
jgi:hypothetical protein